MVDPLSLTMMLGSIGLQFFTNEKNNKKARELQESQKEYQEAAQQKQFDRMRQLQAEQAKLAMELEEDIHRERMLEIEKDYDEVLDRLIDNFALQNWPLNVLPFIMKGESYGSLIRGGSRTLAMHCILTPSNCSNFNKQVYKEIDFRLEAEVNTHWNTQSEHPVVYYGGAWKKINTSEDELLTDIQLLRSQIKSVPCILLTPYFYDNGLIFRITMWGMGDDKTTFSITPPEGLFSYEKYYKKGLSYEYTEEYGDDLYITTIEEFVQYLENLIGAVADKYFWSMYHIVPILPSLNIENKERNLQDIKTVYIEEVTSFQNDDIYSLEDVKNRLNYYCSIRNYLSSEQCNKIESELISISNNLLQEIDDKTKILFSLNDLIDYFDKDYYCHPTFGDKKIDIEDAELLKYVTVETSILDLSEYIYRFREFIEANTDRYNKENVSIYIKQESYKVFYLHVYNIKDSYFELDDNGFDYQIKTKKVKNIYNVKSIFKNMNNEYILCRFERLDKLIERINNNDILIF